jgi:hypothetical protein
MRHRKTALSLAAGAALAAATAAALTLDEFVAGWPLDPPPGAEVFDVPLTAEVYAVAASLDEIAVLDANGTPLPFFRRGVPSVSTPAAPMRSVRVAPLAAAALPLDAVTDAWYFDVGASLPASAVTIAFAGEAGWLRGDVEGSDSLAGPWIRIANDTLFYALTFEGRTFASPPVTVGRREVRYLRVLLESPRAVPPELTLAFPQEYLRVGARGAGPWWLVAGTLAEEAGPDPTFAAVWAEIAPTPRTVPIATLGARQEFGGSAARRASRPFPWRTAALWGVLIGGVLVVGGMAVRLAREMERKPP